MIDVTTTAANSFMSPIKVEWYTDHTKCTGHKARLQACIMSCLYEIQWKKAVALTLIQYLFLFFKKKKFINSSFKFQQSFKVLLVVLTSEMSIADANSASSSAGALRANQRIDRTQVV